MKVRLDNPNPAMGQEEIDEVNVNNVKQLRQAINKTGVNQLLLIEHSTSTAFTSTSYIVPVGMEGAFVASGGWVQINFKAPMGYSGAINVRLRLLIDNEIKDFISLVTPGFEVQQNLSWAGPLSAGRHTVKILASISAGTATFSANSSITRLQISEIVL